MFGAIYIYSRTNKKENTDIYYLDHHTEDDLGEYRGILDGETTEKQKNNMTLPI